MAPGVFSPDLDAIMATDGAFQLLVDPPGGEDMRRFSGLTHGRRCIVGRTTAAGLKLPHRTLVPATRALEAQAGDMVIGGHAVYTAYWPRIARVYLSRFNVSLGPAVSPPRKTIGFPVDLSGFVRDVIMTANDHTFEIWVRCKG